MKYIVYLTTNLINFKTYIGIHKTEDPDIFDGYLGNGVNVNDRHSYRNCRTPFETAVNKYGPSNFRRTTLKVFDNLEDAKKLEEFLVDYEFIARKDTYNIALGGGLPPVSTKTIYQYDLSTGEFIKEWQSITDASIFYKCSSSSIGKAIFDRTPSIGFLWTDFKLDKIDLSEFKIDANKTKVYLYSDLGEYIREYKSISECAQDLNVDASHIQTSCSGKYKVTNYYVSYYKMDKFIIPERKSYKGQPLYQYDLEGNFIKEWPGGYSEVVTFYKKKNMNIHRAIRLGTSCNGFQWSWEHLPKMKKLESKNKATKVGQYTLDGELIQVFNSVREASKIASNVSRCLKGTRKISGGFLWKYINDEIKDIV